MNSRSFPLLYRSARGEQNRTGQKERRCEFAKHDHILGETVWKWQVFRQFSTEREKPSNRSASSVHRESNGISPPETPSTKIKQSRSYSNRSQSLVSLLPGIQPDGDRSVIHSLDLHMLSKSSLRYSSTEFQSQLCQKFLIQPFGFV